MHSHKDKVTDWYEIPCISSCLLWFMRCFGVRSSWCRRCRQSWTSHHSWSSSRCWMSRAFRPVAAWPPVIAAWSPGSTTTSSLDSPSLAMLLTALVNCWGNGVIVWHEGTCDLYSRSLLVVAQRMRPNQCFGSLLWVFFGPLTLLVWWQKQRPVQKIPGPLILKCSLTEWMGEENSANSGLPGNGHLKESWCGESLPCVPRLGALCEALNHWFVFYFIHV